MTVINNDKEYDQFTFIVEVIDQTRDLMDASHMVRSQMNFKTLSLTDIKMDINRFGRKKTLIVADVKKVENSFWGRKLIVQKRKASLNDFDRFKLILAKVKKAGDVRQELAKLKKETAA